MLTRSVVSLFFAVNAASAYQCTSFNVPVEIVDAPSLTPTFAPFESTLDSVQLLDNLTVRTATFQPFDGTQNVSASVNIATQYCVPTGNSSNDIVQILTHGIGFDRSYWDFGGPSSPYNYIKAATAAGFAVLSYDRIGTGTSTLTDPYTVQQLGPATAVLASLTSQLHNGQLSARAGTTIPAPEKVIHVGHSYGSVISSAFVNSNPTSSDGLILTGFSTNATWQPEFAISSNFHIAVLADPERFAEYSNGYLTWGDALANQYSFFQYPYFAPEILEQAERTKMPFSVSDVLTAVPLQTQSPFTGPVLILSGAQDRIFCGADCEGILEQGAAYFPNAQPFESHVQANTGHGLNLHFNSTGAYRVISEFILNNVNA